MERHRGDRHFENHRGGGFSGDAHHHHHSSNHHEHHHSHNRHHSNHSDHHHHNQQDHHYSNHYDHQSNNNHFSNNEPNNSFGGGGFRRSGSGSGHSAAPLSGRKRGFHYSGRGASPDYYDRGTDSFVKLYVAAIPRTVTEDDIRPLFEEHGNVLEIVLLKDKRTGHQIGACFVKYAKLEEADRAIKVLHNLQAFPGSPDTLKVRYADWERERLGTPVEKVYIGGLNKQASEMEIEEIFSPYGVIGDIFIVRDELKQNRGYGFVKFSHRDMAAAAINALNGTYFMRGCDQPLIVRFADPKKPRNGDSRVNSSYGGPNFGLRSQEPVNRLGSNLDDSMGGHVVPNASCKSNSSSAGALPEVVSHLLQQSPSRLPQISSQPGQNLQEPSQPLMQKQRSQVTSQQCPHTERYSQSGATTFESAAGFQSNMSTSPAVPKSSLTAAPFDCDWSEHICPDGSKYYYNCVTCESKWEKPEEYTSFEQLVMKQLQSLSCQQKHKPVHIQSSTSPVTACVQQVS